MKNEENCKIKKQKKKSKYYLNRVNNNIVRQISNNIPFSIKKVIGYYYVCIHYMLAVLSIFILLFSKNLFFLTVMLVFLSLDATSIIFLHNCPLTMLETKYLGYSTISFRRKMLNKLNVLYECNHTYETQLEILINIVSVTACKIMYIIFMDMLSIELKN